MPFDKVLDFREHVTGIPPFGAGIRGLSFLVLSSLRFVRGLDFSHRLRGLPSSSGSPSLLHLRALAPQRHVASSWQGTVEPQPPPHAYTLVAWPVARQGFYGGQPTGYPTDSSPGRSHSPHFHGDRLIRRPPNSAK